MEWNEFVWGLVGFLLTVMILSYLIGDNIFFRLAASLFVGLTAGYLAVLIINEILLPYLWFPLVSGSLNTRLWALVPLVLIGFLGLSQFPRFSRLGTIPLAFLAGLVAALTVGGAVFGTLIPQTRAVIEGFDLQIWQSKGGHFSQIAEALIMLLGTVATLSYFHFGRRKASQPKPEVNQRPKMIEALSKTGQVFIGITFGAIFAGVFSTALLALIFRIAFIGQFITQWIVGNQW
jgi:hypothetical protein